VFNVATVNNSVVDVTGYQALSVYNGYTFRSGDTMTGTLSAPAFYANNGATDVAGYLHAQPTMRNRIINGDMRIDQRNAGASLTQTASTLYSVDRWAIYGTQASKFTAQQNAGSVTPPAGFTNYLGISSSSSYSVTSNDTFQLYQTIEGYNIVDLAWGSADAKSATLSFWVRSSLTGTFGGSIATTKSTVWVFPFSYTITTANVWTYITVSIPAPTTTTGANTDNSAGAYVRFGLGSTGTNVGAAGAWTSSGNYVQPTGTVSVVGTSGATFYITGVQLESGSYATPFERRLFNMELLMCQRYYQTSYNVGTAPGTQTFDGEFLMQSFPNGNLYLPVRYPVVMRSTPTLTFYPGYSAGASPTAGNFWNYGSAALVSASVGRTGTTGYSVEKSSVTANATFGWQHTASAEY
jgi:hypothetical protein